MFFQMLSNVFKCLTLFCVPDPQFGERAVGRPEADLSDRSLVRQAHAEAQQASELPVSKVGKRFHRFAVPGTRGRHPRQHRLHRHRRLQTQAHSWPHLVKQFFL